MPVRKLTSEQRLSRAIDIMEALYAAGENGMTRNEICSRFDITGVSLDEILEIVSTLADRESGARIICECHGERVVLTGDAGRMLPLRLPFYPKSSAITSASLTPSTVGRTGSS